MHLLGERHDAPFVHGVLERFGRIVGSGWPCWALSNHDVTRVATRWGGPEPDPALLRLALECSDDGLVNRFVAGSILRHVWQGGADALEPARLDALQTLGVGVQCGQSVVRGHAACVGMVLLVWVMRLLPST